MLFQLSGFAVTYKLVPSTEFTQGVHTSVQQTSSAVCKFNGVTTPRGFATLHPVASAAYWGECS